MSTPALVRLPAARDRYRRELGLLLSLAIEAQQAAGVLVAEARRNGHDIPPITADDDPAAYAETAEILDALRAVDWLEDYGRGTHALTGGGVMAAVALFLELARDIRDV